MGQYSGENLNNVYKHNRRLVLGILQKHGPISKPQLSEITGLSVPSINNIIRELEAVGLVTQRGLGQSSGGRPPVLYDIDSKGTYIVSVDMSSPNLRLAVVSLKGEILYKTECAAEPYNSTLVYMLIKKLDELLHTREVRSGKVAGVSVAVPGLIDSVNGVVRLSVPLGWRDVPLKSIIEQTFSYPAVIGKETHAGVQALYLFGNSKNLGNVLYIYIGTGIGVGIVVQNQLYKGSNEVSGELGHTVIAFDGPPCECGQRGCLEQVASTKALLRYASEGLDAQLGSDLEDESWLLQRRRETGVLTLSDVFQGARRNDPVAKKAVDKVASYIAAAANNLNRLFDPDVVYVGGSLGLGNEVLFDSIKRHSADYPGLLDGYELSKKILPAFSDDIVLLGASTWVTDRLFESIGMPAARTRDS